MYDSVDLLVANLLKDVETITTDSTMKHYGKWEAIVNAYGELEGFLCECGRQSMEASNYCPSCGKKMFNSD